MEYDIFIDESGLFIETSTDPADRIKHHTQNRKFASQLAGVVCPAGRLNESIAREMLDRSLKAAGIAPDHEFHSSRVRGRSKSAFNQFVELLVTEIQAEGLQLIRMVNAERVSFGERTANYTNILAEFLVRVCNRLESTSNGSAIKLNVCAAKVRGDEDDRGVFEFIDRADYLARIRERFAMTAIANGWGERVAKWSIEGFRLGSGKDDPRLWVADAVSNASHDDYKTLSPEASQILRSAIGDFDFTLSFNLTLQRVRELADREQYAAAVIELGERELSNWTSSSAKTAYHRELESLVPRLFALPPVIGVPQLQVILGWLRQLSENRERLADARKACVWFENRVLDSKIEAMATPIDEGLANWMRIGLATASLTACNHGGEHPF